MRIWLRGENLTWRATYIKKVSKRDGEKQSKFKKPHPSSLKRHYVRVRDAKFSRDDFENVSRKVVFLWFRIAQWKMKMQIFQNEFFLNRKWLKNFKLIIVLLKNECESSIKFYKYTWDITWLYGSIRMSCDTNPCHTRFEDYTKLGFLFQKYIFLNKQFIKYVFTYIDKMHFRCWN